MAETTSDPKIEELLAKAKKPSADAMELHPFYRGKVEVALKARVRDFNDFEWKNWWAITTTTGKPPSPAACIAAPTPTP